VFFHAWARPPYTFSGLVSFDVLHRCLWQQIKGIPGKRQFLSGYEILPIRQTVFYQTTIRQTQFIQQLQYIMCVCTCIVKLGLCRYISSVYKDDISDSSVATFFKSKNALWCTYVHVCTYVQVMYISTYICTIYVHKFCTLVHTYVPTSCRMTTRRKNSVFKRELFTEVITAPKYFDYIFRVGKAIIFKHKLAAKREPFDVTYVISSTPDMSTEIMSTVIMSTFIHTI
jgi:hypothetical protein